MTPQDGRGHTEPGHPEHRLDFELPAAARLSRPRLVVLLALGVALVVVDAVVQFVVNSASISAVSPTTWMIASPFIAFGLGGITHGVAQALTFDPTRPQRAVRRCC